MGAYGAVKTNSTVEMSGHKILLMCIYVAVRTFNFDEEIMTYIYVIVKKSFRNLCADFIALFCINFILNQTQKLNVSTHVLLYFQIK